jgi:protein phosphatase
MSQVTKIEIPAHALVLPVGPAGCGKSYFAEQHFPRTAIVSSDLCREMVSDDMTNQECNRHAFHLFHEWIGARLAMRKLVYADATNVRGRSRKELRQIAAATGAPVIVFRFAADLDTCLSQNRQRDRFVPEHVIKSHVEAAEESREHLSTEGYAAIYTINPSREYEIVVKSGVQAAEAPGFDIIGDIHGCEDELKLLLHKLGYRIGTLHAGEGSSYVHPQGRKLVFVGDITDRGPRNVGALRTVKLALEGGHLSVMGNHDDKLRRALKGNKVQMGHGLAETYRQLYEDASHAERQTFYEMLVNTPYQIRLAVPGYPEVTVCHAGLPQRLVGLDNNEARNHAIYGEVLGFGPDGTPVRGDAWKDGWRAGVEAPWLVHGHTVTQNPRPTWEYNVVNVDTGCVFGGYLTAFRYPSCTIEQVRAFQVYNDRLPQIAGWER